MKYLSIWKTPQPRPVRHRPSPGDVRLPRRVKDWPADAQEEFKRIKNELWKWVKNNNVENKTGLALIAYEAVKQVWEDRPDPRTNMEVIDLSNTEEELWSTMRKLSKR